MDKISIIGKIGTILSDLQKQQKFFAENQASLNEVEVELFSASANYLAEYAKVLKKFPARHAGSASVLPPAAVPAGLAQDEDEDIGFRLSFEEDSKKIPQVSADKNQGLQVKAEEAPETPKEEDRTEADRKSAFSAELRRPEDSRRGPDKNAASADNTDQKDITEKPVEPSGLSGLSSAGGQEDDRKKPLFAEHERPDEENTGRKENNTGGTASHSKEAGLFADGNAPASNDSFIRDEPREEIKPAPAEIKPGAEGSKSVPEEVKPASEEVKPAPEAASHPASAPQRQATPQQADAPRPAATPRPAAAPQPDAEQDEPRSVSLNDRFQENKSTLYERIAQPKQQQSQSPGAPIANLGRSIGINERYYFIKTLFQDDKVAFDQAITRIDMCSSLGEALEYANKSLSGKYNWSRKEEDSRKFYDLLKRRFV